MYRKKITISIIVLVIFLLSKIVSGFVRERPFIWVQQQDKEDILKKIEEQPWANSLFIKFRERLDEEIQLHQSDPVAFLKKLPFDWKNQTGNNMPPLQSLNRGTGDDHRQVGLLSHYLQMGVDCGMFWYLTGEERYARCASDILYAVIRGIIQIPFPENVGNFGWVQPSDHLYEARAIGAQIPVIYDFVHPFLKSGGKPFDFILNENVPFPFETAQKVFLGYARLAIDQGMTGSNWSILEGPSLVHNLLAIENEQQLDSLLEIFLNTGSPRQDPLSVVASHFRKIGDVYPETSQYSNGVAQLSTVLMTILSHYKPSLQLGHKYKLIPLALSRWDAIKYPNGQIIRFGDGKRYGGISYSNCEFALHLGYLEDEPEIKSIIGNLLSTAISEGRYQRDHMGGRNTGANIYYEPLRLLWGVPQIEGSVEDYSLPRTDDMPHASVFLQRNLSSSGEPKDDLMCFVGGAHMVHGHAEGMNIELYRCGHILGVDNGRGSYRQDIHENYSRLFAAHNTVIVNGNSRSDGGWVNLGINPVQLVAMEPMPRADAVSPWHSFSLTSFADDRGDQTEAYQERTLALIRTSETTGYYVDVFRSKSELPDEFHDYLYHNIGDKLDFLNGDLHLKPTPERFQANANLPWVQNRQYRHPGWHFFEEVQTSASYKNDVFARFTAARFEEPIFMDLYIPGFENREYTKVMAPHTFEAPQPYLNKQTPTLVIRKNGEAWNDPFVVVFEPFMGSDNNSVISVEKLVQDGEYKGVKVVSHIDGEKLVQYIITQVQNDRFIDESRGILFSGTFAVISVSPEGRLKSMYIGEGDELRYGDIVIKTTSQKKSVYREFAQ